MGETMDEADPSDESDGEPATKEDEVSEEQKAALAVAAEERKAREKESLDALEEPKPGDWRVVVHVLQVRQMQPSEKFATVSPMVTVEVFGKKQSTKIAKGRTSARSPLLSPLPPSC